MFKVNIYAKFALIAVGLIGGIILTATIGFGYGWIFLLTGILFLVSYFMMGTIQTASEMVQAQDFVGAEERLKLTYFPNLLYSTNKAIYYMLKGSLAAQRKETAVAEGFFNKALSMKLNSDDEKAMILLQMAGIKAQQGNWNGAKAIMYQTRNLKVTQTMIKDQVKQFDQAIAQRGQVKVAQSMGMNVNQMGMGGGKRRRPKMR
jgi:hypothetical protein